MNLKIFLLLLVVSITQGCVKEQIVVTKTTVKPLIVPKSLTQNCKISPPPDKKEFMAMNLLNRQTALAKYINALLKDLKTCNSRLKAIRQWNNKQKRIYSEQE